ncbi:nucleoside ABC transporter ATP-binding protein [Salinihabitans flavidus]|uniref:Nucleoside ABC transporter ATP-binding protein n=1 Tax=Salinihabitans flavidus TaxID=569882 RepID=A0A1H8W4M2_9RHOB|nr:ABC transporter ATP-binding protein [Salinihabitans flavidus]SEP22586.1 nucleoside ABC transporter ATP-binding protein [Salinihabitans flavidus]
MTDTNRPPEDGALLSLRGVSKYFPGVIANEAVDLDIRPGEIHAILGENGAGKSTLMNVVTGIYQPNAGNIYVNGKAMRFAAPADAIAAGIGMVHQHFKLVKTFTVAENIHLGWKDMPALAKASEIEARTQAISDRFNLGVHPGARVDSLSAGEQQRVEILRVLARGAGLLILDEPTAVLTPPEARDLFRALDDFRKAGNSVIFISHKLNEVMEICDRVTVLRAGRNVAMHPVTECSPNMLASLMVGSDFDTASRPVLRSDAQAPIGPPVMSLRGVGVIGPNGVPTLRDVDLDLCGGEILGIAGVAGNGQRELGQVISGVLDPTSGEIQFDGQPANGKDAAAFARFGVGHIPEDRIRSGLAPSLSITDNAVLREYNSGALGLGPFFNPRAADALARGISKDAGVVIPDFRMPVRNLSGGNQQRLVARREMRIARRLLVAAYPSRGLDIGAIETMHGYLGDLRDQGVAVVVISEDLDELLALSDRIAVLHEGRNMGTINIEAASSETIGLMMGGENAA